MSQIVEGMVAVKMPSKFDDTIRVKLEDGGWYGANANIAGSIRKGAVVKLKVERYGKNLMIEKVREVTPPAPGSDSSGRSGWSGKGKSQGGYTPDPARENSIHYQSARKDAIAVLIGLLENGALSLGSKASEKEAVFLARLDALTADFYGDIGTLGAVTRTKAQTDESEEFDAGEEASETAAEDDFEDDDVDF